MGLADLRFLTDLALVLSLDLVLDLGVVWNNYASYFFLDSFVLPSTTFLFTLLYYSF